MLGGLDSIKGLTYATAHYRNGILLAPVTAAIVADLVLNGTIDDEYRIFSPERFNKLYRAI